MQNNLGIYSTESGHDDMPDPEIVQSLIAMLDECNPLVKQFRMARDRLLSPTAPDVSIRLVGTSDTSADRYSLLAVDELAALIVGGDSSVPRQFDIIVESRQSRLKHISPIHPALVPLQYPLLFPYADKGYQLGIKFKNGAGGAGSNRGARDTVSMMEYHCYYTHYRKDEPNPIICSGRLSQQYIVNAYSCVEADRLSFHYHNQKLLRSETYQGISDAIARGASTGRDVGVKRVLPASYPGSKRHMNQNYHDCMAISRAYGPPSLFTTFTCNAC